MSEEALEGQTEKVVSEVQEESGISEVQAENIATVVSLVVKTVVLEDELKRMRHNQKVILVFVLAVLVGAVLALVLIRHGKPLAYYLRQVFGE